MERVSAQDIAAVVASYKQEPLGASGKLLRNSFGGLVGASAATVWDYCLICTPGKCWTLSDIVAVYFGLNQRGLVVTASKGARFCANGVPAAEVTVGHTAYNKQHTAEHVSSTRLAKAYQDPKTGKLIAHAVVVAPNTWAINPEFVATAGLPFVQKGYAEAGMLPTFKPAKPTKPASKPKAKPTASKPAAPRKTKAGK